MILNRPCCVGMRTTPIQSDRAWSSTRTACSTQLSRRTGKCSPFCTLLDTDSVYCKRFSERSAEILSCFPSRHRHGSAHKQRLPETNQALQGEGEPRLQGSLFVIYLWEMIAEIWPFDGLPTGCGVRRQPRRQPRWSAQEVLWVRQTSSNLRRHYSGTIPKIR